MQPTILSKGYRYRRLKHTPFEQVGGLFGKLQAWCRHCQMEVDYETATGRLGGIDVYRRRCLRCGRVLAYAMDRVQMIGEKPVLVHQAETWLRTPGDDRR